MSKFYITTAIHYVNDDPHIGHMYENIVADVMARHRRRMGDDVRFLTGTDEHGQKIERAAAKEGIRPIELADRVVRTHHDLKKLLNVSYDDFIRTTEPRHHAGVLEVIRRIRERNPDDIYPGEHSGWYCQSEETYIPENQVHDGLDQDGHKVEWTTERNYFFRLSRYTEPLLEHYRTHPGFIWPETRMNEVRTFVEQGLRDLSISRSSVKWGIPFPGDPEHVIYVWLDALINYMSALGFGNDDHANWDRYWPADMHLIGKDIIRFHTVYWPAFLMAAGIELPRRIVGHGFWLRDHVKISKSLGNVVRPYNILDDFGPDALRYYVMREMVFGQDQDYSDESLLTRYNADLANDLGNTLSRTIKMSDSYFGGKTPSEHCPANELRTKAEAVVPVYLRHMDELAFQRAIESAWELLSEINSYIVTREPWKHYKENGADSALARVLWCTLEALRIVWTMMAPFLPGSTREALSRLGADPDFIDARALEWGWLETDAPVRVTDPIFPRVDVANYIGGTKPVEEPQKQQPVGTPPQSGAPIETTQAAPPDLAKITIDRFLEVDLRVAEIRAAERVPKSKKLIQLTVFTGDGERTLVAGIGTSYTPEELVGRKVVIVANLQPAKLMGIESNGMILAASIGGEPSLLSVDPDVPAGTRVR
jgi:methionyl-tRNA synthetase